jgi:hypothetical protein
MINNDQMLINMPGRIVEFFPEDQTATVKICVEKTFANSDTEAGTITRGLLHDVPVHVSQGGGWAMTHPITAGDTCDLMFSQVGYDYWLFLDKDESGTLAGLPKPHLKRSFSEEDGYALVGFNPLPRAIQGYSADSSQWRNVDSEQMISLNEDLSITIKAGTTTVQITKDGTVAITAPLVTLTGDLNVTGTITSGTAVVAPSMLANGSEVAAHDHDENVPPL